MKKKERKSYLVSDKTVNVGEPGTPARSRSATSCGTGKQVSGVRRTTPASPSIIKK